MSYTSFKISIPEGCSERLSDMKSTENGRFCTSCQKNVVDFTMMSDSEIMAIINSKKFNGCGTFNEYQLNRNLVDAADKNIGFGKHSSLYDWFIIVGFTGFLTAIPELLRASPKFIIVKNIKDSINTLPISLRGKITDLYTGEAVINARVSVNGADSVLTNEDGAFEVLIYNDSGVSRQEMIQVYHVDYHLLKQFVVIRDTGWVKDFKLVCKSEAAEGDDVVVLGFRQDVKRESLTSGVMAIAYEKKKRKWWEFWKWFQKDND